MKDRKGTQRRRKRTPNPLAAEILAKIADYETRPILLLDEMLPEELEQIMQEIQTWLQQARPRTIRYISRRAHLQQSNDLDEEMVEDIWWHRFLAVNIARYQQLKRDV